MAPVWLSPYVGGPLDRAGGQDVHVTKRDGPHCVSAIEWARFCSKVKYEAYCFAYWGLLLFLQASLQHSMVPLVHPSCPPQPFQS